MTRKPLVILAALCTFGSSSSFAQTAAPSIEITPAEGGATVEGYIVGLGSGNVEGRLTILKHDAGGTSNLSQSRSVDIVRGLREVIGRTTLSLQPGASLQVELIILENGEEVASATTRFGAQHQD